MNRVNRFVLHKQHLAEDSNIDDIIQIARDISGLHATGAKEPYLALFARTRNFTKEQLNHALYARKSLGKIRCMRGTLYILTREMIPIAFAATKAMVEKLSRKYAEFRGVSMNEYLDASQSIMDILKGKEMTPAEIKARVGVQLYLPAVLNLMCDQGLLMRIQSEKSWEARAYRYALFGEYFPDIDLAKFDEAEATTLLVQRYLSSFGPATETDISWWLGLSKAKVREALDKIKRKVAEVSIPNLNGDFIVLRSDLELITGLELTGKPEVNLLPQLDPYIMGYKQRERYLSQEHYYKVFDRSGNATSTILLDGKVIGIWDFSKEAKPQVKLHLFEAVNYEIMQLLHSKAQEMGQFMAGKKVAVKEVASMVPLNQRAPGAFMSPLKSTGGQ